MKRSTKWNINEYQAVIQEQIQNFLGKKIKKGLSLIYNIFFHMSRKNMICNEFIRKKI